MLDDDDLEFTILAWPVGGWIITILGLVVVVWMAIKVSQNREDCSKLHCKTGSAVLMHHECLCVEKPTQ